MELVYIHQKTSKLAEAERLFSVFVSRAGDETQELSRYFSLRKKWEAGQFEALSSADLKFLTLAKKRFAKPSFEHQFAEWKEGKNLTQEEEKKPTPIRRFIPYQVKGSYDFLGELD